jgi:hypothetical protein
VVSDVLDEGHTRMYVVVPTGTFEDDPNVTDKKLTETPPGPTAAPTH